MSEVISVISSMAPKVVLAELARIHEYSAAVGVTIQSVGGVHAKERVLGGEDFDVVVLASDAIDELLAAGRLKAGSKVDLMHAGVGVAIRTGAPRPAIDSEALVKQAVLRARSLGYSTGPSGLELARLFERWGISQEVRGRIVTPPPGVPVGALIARGEVELGFQQLSELMHVEGIDVLGALPPEIQIVTTFSAGVGAASKRPDSARALIAFMASRSADGLKRRRGMDPGRPRRRHPDAPTE